MTQADTQRTQLPKPLPSGEHTDRWRRFSIDNHNLIAMPRADWRTIANGNGAGARPNAVGFVRLRGAHYVLVPNDDLQPTSLALPPITTVLTSRELQIAHFVAEGKCDKVIAHELGISQYTVREHMRRAFRKLKVSKRASLVARMIGKILE